MLTVAEIRARYPSPRDLLEDDETEASYCVGGSLCMTLTGGHLLLGGMRFPRSSTLAVALCKCNPNIPAAIAANLAESIIDANDAGLFDQAWTVLSEALEFTPSEGQSDQEYGQ